MAVCQAFFLLSQKLSSYLLYDKKLKGSEGMQ
nr:MAG TPA: hypothetical protein [Siphoviridae sp. ctqkP4]